MKQTVVLATERQVKAVFMVYLETLEKSLSQIADSEGQREGKDEKRCKRKLLRW